MADITLVVDSGEITLSADEVREMRDKALSDCGFQSMDEYRAYMDGKCHHKCWRPEGVRSISWYSIEVWDSLLGSDHG